MRTHGTAALAQAIATGAGTTPLPGPRYRLRYTCRTCGSSWMSLGDTMTGYDARARAWEERIQFRYDGILVRVEGPL